MQPPVIPTIAILVLILGALSNVTAEDLYVSKVFTERNSFTGGVEGPAVYMDGNVYAVNYEKQATIGKVTPDGDCSIFITLPNGSVGNGIRFDSQEAMFIADYVNHNVLRVDMRTREVSVLAHEPKMNQPNDLAIGSNDILYCSDPNWGESMGSIWRVTPDGKATRLDANVGTTNGIEVSPDDKTLYVNESVQRNVWAYDLSPTGDISNKRLLIKFEDFGMDGMRCDAEGNLYITRYGKSTVAIVSPTGKLLREVQLTGKSPSNLAFGGPDGRTVYVTLADQGNLESFRTEVPGRAWKLRAMRKTGPKSVPRFVRHVIDAEFGALGADIGDRDARGMADIIACTGNEVYWYAAGEKHLIHKLDGSALYIHLRTVDVDLDGDTDAIVADHTNGIRYLENPGRGPAKKQPWPHHFVDQECKGAHAVALADINRDGRIDVVASGEATSTPPDSIYWFECPPNPNEVAKWPKHVFGPGQSGGLAHYPGIGDVNGDGRLDVVHAAKKGEWYRLWTQPADATRPWNFSVVGTDYIQATNVQVGDVNGDGVADLLASQGHHFGVLWFEGPDWKPHMIDKELKSPHTLVLADLDADGDLDGATCAYESKVLVWFENDGKGGFQSHVLSTDQCAYDLVARDVDRDGDLDLVIAGQDSGNVLWYEQTQKTVATPSDLPLLHTDDFSSGSGLWMPSDRSAWKVVEMDGNTFYSQFKKRSDFEPPHRSPYNLSLLSGVFVGDFALTTRVRSTHEDYAHRDVCLFFGYQDSAHFYYVHLGKKADAHANQIFIVNEKPRTKISLTTTPGTDWDDAWHDVKIVRTVADGTIEVYFDDMTKPVMTAKDTTFTWGRVGVGSFDDTSDWDDFVLRGAKVNEPSR